MARNAKSELKSSSFDVPLQVKHCKSLGIALGLRLVDPRVADWVINPEDNKSAPSIDVLLEKHTKEMQLKGRAQDEYERSCKHAVQSLVLWNRLEGLLKFNLLQKVCIVFSGHVSDCRAKSGGRPCEESGRGVEEEMRAGGSYGE